jgi:hypothetical protein
MLPYMPPLGEILDKGTARKANKTMPIGKAIRFCSSATFLGAFDFINVLVGKPLGRIEFETALSCTFTEYDLNDSMT